MPANPHFPGLPDWAMDLFDKHSLGERTDDPLGAVILLLNGASEALSTAAITLFEEQAATPDMVRIAGDAVGVAQEALALAQLCDADPLAGELRCKPNGSIIWEQSKRKESGS